MEPATQASPRCDRVPAATAGTAQSVNPSTRLRCEQSNAEEEKRKLTMTVMTALFFLVTAMHGTFRGFVCPVVCGLACPGALWIPTGRCLSAVLLAGSVFSLCMDPVRAWTVAPTCTAKMPAPQGRAAIVVRMMTARRAHAHIGHSLELYSRCSVFLCSLSVPANKRLRLNIIAVGVLCILVLQWPTCKRS